MCQNGGWLGDMCKKSLMKEMWGDLLIYISILRDDVRKKMKLYG